EGAYSVVVLTEDGIWAMRDPRGFRPLCIGTLETGDGREGFVVASESCALETIGAKYVREVRPGEIVGLGPQGLRSWMALETLPERALCVFEYVYFARPDSQLEDRSVHAVREAFGRRLGVEAPAEADIVVGIPDSAIPAAVGFAEATGIPYREGLAKNRYIGRTFIQPDAQLRKDKVRLKYNPLRDSLAGKRVVLVDDSIVRGSTAGPLVRLVRDAGATEVHVRVSSPPVRHPCFMGVDLGTYEEIIAARTSIEAIREHIGADSLAYLSHDGMMEVVRDGLDATDGRCGHCRACFTGEYPITLEDRAAKSSFEGIHGA
ncbi:MAG: amidophosphoribosyltransferase, partial [Alphaproteobacteria bacterium]|nr:amidophosphoribosyltransferase [Alphaproteobacteria bacterium]